MTAFATGDRAVGDPPFGLDALQDYLSRRLNLRGPMRIAPVAGGQSNPTYFIQMGDRRLVLRKKPPGRLLPSAHAVDREFRVQSALAGTGVPVAPMVLFHPNDDIVGTPFYVMDHVEGRIFSDGSLGGVPRADRATMYRCAAHALASIHEVDVDRAGLRDFGRSGGYLERQIARWTKQWALSGTNAIPEIDLLAEWLGKNLPRGTDETTLVHGDFRIGNLIFHPVEPRIVAVLDWELSTLGDPLADLAHACIFGWHIRPEEYGGILGVDLAEEGLPTLEEFVAAYNGASPVQRRLTPYHLAFALFRNAVIFAGISQRGREGNASSHDAVAVGALAPIFAKRGLALTQA